MKKHQSALLRVGVIACWIVPVLALSAQARAIEITSMTVSATDVVESFTHTTTITTNQNYQTVEWRVDGNPAGIQNGPAMSSVLKRGYRSEDGFGGPLGAPVTIEAVVTDANGQTDSASKTINVWSSSNSISIISKTPNHRLVEDEYIDIFVETDVGFWYVYWYINRKFYKIDSGPGTVSQITFYADIGDGDRNGSEYRIEAVVYGINTNGVLAKDSEETSVFVYGGHGYVWKEITARVDSITHIGGHSYELGTTHTVDYYNDDDEFAFPQTLHHSIGWWEGDTLFSTASKSRFDLRRAYSTVRSFSMTKRWTLKPELRYGASARTSFGHGLFSASIGTVADEVYNGDLRGLPPTGEDSLQNPTRLAEFLFD